MLLELRELSFWYSLFLDMCLFVFSFGCRLYDGVATVHSCLAKLVVI